MITSHIDFFTHIFYHIGGILIEFFQIEIVLERGVSFVKFFSLIKNEFIILYIQMKIQGKTHMIDNKKLFKI